MALKIADRVKETSLTQGSGSLTLEGAFGGFQTFSATVGDGNTTYYVIENESKWEVGIGTYTSSSNTLSRDTVLKSSQGGDKINIYGVATVFCSYPAGRAVIRQEDGLITESGLLTLTIDSAGNFFHAYKDDAYDRTIGLYTDGNTSPEWRLGLKNSPSDKTDPPSFGYVYGKDGQVGLVGNSNNSITLSNSSEFSVKHNNLQVLRASSLTGIHLNANSSAYPAVTINGAAAQSQPLTEWADSAGNVLSIVDQDGKVGINKTSATYELDVDGSGRLESVYLTSGIYFQDGTFQATAHSDVLTNQVSGWADNTMTSRDNAVSGYFETRTDQNANDIISVSGVAVYASGHNLQSITDNGSSTTNSISSSGNITATTAVLDVLDLTLLSDGSQPSYSEGVVFYDSENHTLSLYNDEADVTLQLGQEEFLRVRNNTGSTIYNGSSVRITGAHGASAPTVELAIATTEEKSQIVGLATHDIENNSFGYVTTYGIVRDVNTAAFSAGDELFLDASTSGNLTNVSPTIPNHKVTVGHVIRSHVNGSILVQIGHPKLGGGDLKSEATVALSGVPFVTTVADTNAGGMQTNSSFVYDSGNNQLQLGSGVQLLNAVPGNTTNVLYNDGGTLKFNGSAIAGGGGGDVTTEQLEGVSGIAVYASGQADNNTADILTVSGLLYDDASLSGYVDSRDTAVSGWAQAYVDSQDHSAAAVSGWAGSYADAGDAAVSGWADSTMDTRDAAVSGWADSTMTSRDNAISGYAEAYTDAAVTEAGGYTAWNISDGTVAGDAISNDETVYISGVSGITTDYSSNLLKISAASLSGWADSTMDTRDAAVSGWANATFVATDNDTTYTAGSGLFLDGNNKFHSTFASGNYLLGEIRENSSSGVVISGIANEAYGWGDHSSAGYLTSETSHSDVLVDGDFTSQGIMKRGASAGSYSIITDNSSNWDTAYSWGDHSTQGYLTSDSDTTYTGDSGVLLQGTVFNANLVDYTVQSTAANSRTTTASRTYAVQVDSSDKLVVNVPWVDTDTDNDTTYTAGSGLELHGTEFQAAISGANLLATNTPSDNQIASYDAATGKFTWVSAGAGENNEFSFKTISVAGQSDVVADTTTDTLTLAAGSNVTITTNAGTDTITIASTDTTYSTATSSALGLVKIEDDTEQSVAANTVSTTAGRTYGVQLNSDDQLVVNVPWTDTDTQLSTEQVQDIAGALVATGGTKTGITISYEDSTGDMDFTVDHDAADNFQANEHVDHTAVTLTAGDGLTGGGDISANRTFTVVGDSGVLVTDKVHANLVDYTVQTTAANSRTTTASRTYAIQVDSSDKLVVNVPWSDTDTTYSEATSLSEGLMSTAHHDKLDGIEAGADVTDATNVTAAGALMDSEVTNLAFVKGLTKGISDGNVLTANDAVADDDFLRINGTEVEGLTAAEVRTALNVEDGATADQTQADINGLAITTVGTIDTGTWQGTAIADAYIASAATWNAKQSALTFGIANTNAVKIDAADVADNEYARFTANGLESRTIGEIKTDLSLAKGDVGLGNVENTALSTWPGTTNITTVGTISNGTWQGTAIGSTYIADAFLKNDADDTTSGTVTMANLIIGDAGNIGSASDNDAVAIASDGEVTLSQRTTFSKAQKTPIKSNTDGATVTFDLDEANTHTVTLGGDRTLALSNADVGQKFIIRLQQDATGNRTVTWFSGIDWPGNLVPTLTTTASKTDVFGFICTGTDAYDGFVIGYKL